LSQGEALVTGGRRPYRRSAGGRLGSQRAQRKASPPPCGAKAHHHHAASGRRAELEEAGMWKVAAVVAMVTVAGASAHAQQQQSVIETLEKTMSDLAMEGYEIKAAEDLSGDIPKFVLQKAESIVICQINFSDGEENCFQLRSRGR
jgi:hypothetical protein